MSNDSSPRVVRVISLESFQDEIPADGQPVVRLLYRQVEGRQTAVLLLSLQGLSTAGDIVWLCEAHTISWLYGKPFGPAAESAVEAMRQLESIVRGRLESLGYRVRSGDYGLPESVKPLGATFECARWVRLDEHRWAVQPVLTGSVCPAS